MWILFSTHIIEADRLYSGLTLSQFETLRSRNYDNPDGIHANE